MKLSHFWIATLFIALDAMSPARAVPISLLSLSDPTLDQLINLPVPVSVGGLEFSNFSLANLMSGTGASASQIEVVQPTNGVWGLRFVSSWFAANGNAVDEVISYDVRTTDSSRTIIALGLLSNGTAPAPAIGTFSSTTVVSETSTGSLAAAVLSTYNDGVIVPIDTTKPDVNYVQTPVFLPADYLHISETISENTTPVSNTSSGGVASQSIIQNTFAEVPEPSSIGWLLLPIAFTVFGLNRRSSDHPART